MLCDRKSVLIVIDMQEKLLPVMHEKNLVTDEVIKAINAAKHMDIPLYLTEHFSNKLGKTIPSIREHFSDENIYEKTAMSCCADQKFRHFVEQTKSSQFILVGIETHICIYQTAFDLLNMGKEVYVIEEAISSRSHASKILALQRLKQKGAEIINFEMLVFEWLRDANHPKFKSMIQWLKST